MLFYVIYEVDAPRGSGGASPVAPDGWRRKSSPWIKTEGGSSEYSHLGGDWGFGSSHAKWVGGVTRQEFDALASKAGLSAEDVETMGSLTGFGWLPAISFHGSDYDERIISAYVTPLPAKRNGEPIRKDGATERDWERIRQAIICHYK